MTEGKQEWRYETKKGDPEELKDALTKLVADDDDLTELDLSDDYESAPVKLLVYDDKSKPCQVNGKVTINFKEFTVHLSPEISEVCSVDQATGIDAKRVRYTGLPHGDVDGKRNDGRIVLLSFWGATEDRPIRNLYFQAEDVRSAALLVSAFTRCVYEAFEKNAVRTHKFCALAELPIDVAFTSTDERDARDAIKVQQLSKDNKPATDGSDEKMDSEDDDLGPLPELKMSRMYLVLDEEALLLFDAPFCLRPLHDFRFYRESLPRSIDTIFVCHEEDQMEVQNIDKVFYLQPHLGDDHEAFKELVGLLRRQTVKPKPQAIFISDSGKEFADFFASGNASKVNKTPKASFTPDLPFTRPLYGPSRDIGDLGPAAALPGPASQENVWLGNLNSGSHLATVNDEMQVQWFAIESEIETVIKDGKVPQIDMSSAGLNPESFDQLLTCVEDIREKILTNKHGEAVSKLRGCREIFGKTLLSPLDGVNEIDILKRIYLLVG